MYLSVQRLKKTHRYPMAQDPIEYNERWNRTFEGQKRMSNIEDKKILVEDASEREG